MGRVGHNVLGDGGVVAGNKGRERVARQHRPVRAQHKHAVRTADKLNHQAWYHGKEYGIMKTHHSDTRLTAMKKQIINTSRVILQCPCIATPAAGV